METNEVTSKVKIMEAKNHLSEARKCLEEAIDPDTIGSCNYNSEFIADVEEYILYFIRFKRRIVDIDKYFEL